VGDHALIVEDEFLHALEDLAQVVVDVFGVFGV